MKTITRLSIALICVLVFACAESVLEPEAKLSEQELQQAIQSDIRNVTFNGRFLEFSTPASFNQTLESVNQVTDANVIVNWGSQFGFTSARALLEQATKEQSAFLEAAAQKIRSVEEGNGLVDQSNALPSISENGDLFRFDSDGLVSGVRSFHVGSWALINNERLVKVGGNIMQFNEESVKIILGGDESRIPSLEHINETDSTLGIFVYPVVNQKTPASGRSNWAYHDIPMGWEDKCDTYNYYMRGDIDVSSWTVPVYGTEQICNCSPTARPVEGCNCYYPIVGYSYWIHYTTHTVSKRSLLGVVWQYSGPNSYHKHMLDYSVNGIPADGSNVMPSNPWRDLDPDASGTCHECANLWTTAYDGPGSNITESYNYYTYFWLAPCYYGETQFHYSYHWKD